MSEQKSVEIKENINEDLVEAIRRQVRWMVKKLIRDGADPHYNNDLPIREAVMSESSKIIALVTTSRDRTNLIIMRAANELNITNKSVKAILKGGIDNFYYPLKLARQYGDSDLVKLLERYNQDVEPSPEVEPVGERVRYDEVKEEVSQTMASQQDLPSTSRMDRKRTIVIGKNLVENIIKLLEFNKKQDKLQKRKVPLGGREVSGVPSVLGIEYDNNIILINKVEDIKIDLNLLTNKLGYKLNCTLGQDLMGERDFQDIALVKALTDNPNLISFINVNTGQILCTLLEEEEHYWSSAYDRYKGIIPYSGLILDNNGQIEYKFAQHNYFNFMNFIFWSTTFVLRSNLLVINPELTRLYALVPTNIKWIDVSPTVSGVYHNYDKQNNDNSNYGGDIINIIIPINLKL
jgi:hypothetical protein